MDVFKVWVPPREHLSVQALFGAAIALYWKIFERQNSMHLAFLKHQNTKTFLYKLSKNHCIGLLHFWKFLGPSEEKYNLQSIWITPYENTLKNHENRPQTMKQRRTKLLGKMIPFLVPQVEGADSTSRIMNLKCH